MSGNENERPGGRLRVGDQEREAATRRLGEHYEAGRLTADEHAERTDQALRAKTEADLAGLFDDLPGHLGTADHAAGHTTGHATGHGAGHAAGDAGGHAAGQTAGRGGEGPWGWGIGAPWTAPQDSRGGRGGRHPGGAAWTEGRQGPGRLPVPLLAALAALAVVFTIGCTVIAGHPPVLPLLAVLTGVFVVLRRRKEGRA